MLRKRNIYKGQIFWKLEVIGEVDWYKDNKWHKQRYAKCRCFCWNIIDIRLSWLFSWNNIACWCWIRRKHWMRHTRLYKCWGSMKWRCDRVSNKSYSRYGWRWITYDEKWKNFEWFYEDMKDWYMDNLTLDRIDNNWHYNKNNCKWATCKQQSRNTSSNIMYKWKCVSQWCEELQLNKFSVYAKLKKWINIEDIFTF